MAFWQYSEAVISSDKTVEKWEDYKFASAFNEAVVTYFNAFSSVNVKVTGRGGP
jgi:hypothetical protein